MRRLADGEGSAPPAKRQATLARFFPGAPALANVPDTIPEELVLKCSYCDKVVIGNFSAAPGGLKLHVKACHPFEHQEAELQADRVSSFISATLFDFEPMELIPEGIDLPDNSNNDLNGRVDEEMRGEGEKAKILRHSYTVKDKYKVLRLVENIEKRLRDGLGADNVFSTVPALDIVCRKTGIPMRTVRNWIEGKEEIRRVYEEQKRSRKLKRLGSGRRALFPKAEAVVAQMV